MILGRLCIWLLQKVNDSHSSGDFYRYAAFSDWLYFRSSRSCEVLNRNMQSESSC